MEEKIKTNKKADMTASDMYSIIAKRTGQTTAIVRSIILEYANTVKTVVGRDGGCVLLPETGKFVRSSRKGFTGRNPKTGESVEVKPSAIVRFIPNSKLRNITRVVGE